MTLRGIAITPALFLLSLCRQMEGEDNIPYFHGYENHSGLRQNLREEAQRAILLALPPKYSTTFGTANYPGPSLKTLRKG